MSYHLAFDGPILVIQLSGTVTGTDLKAVGEVLALEDNGRNTPPRLTDLRAMDEPAIGYLEVANLADLTRTRPVSAMIGPRFSSRAPFSSGSLECSRYSTSTRV